MAMLVSVFILTGVGVFEVTTTADGDATRLATLTMILWELAPASFALCGASILLKRPENPVGWVLMIPGLTLLQSLMPVVSSQQPPASVGAVEVAQLWFSNISWMLLLFPVFHLLLVFPGGRLLRPRWKLLVRLELTMFLVLSTLALFVEEIGPIDEAWTVANPIGVVPSSVFGAGFVVLWGAGLIALTVFGVIAVVQRFRSGTTVERLQIKWLLLAASAFGAAYLLASAFDASQGQPVLDLILVCSLLSIPVAIMIAVSRYHLYEIDRIVSRTLAYSLIAAVLGSLFAIGVVWLPSWLGLDNSIAVAGTTLGVAAIFSPLRRRVHRWVDRRFNRSRYNAEQIVDEFSKSLRERVEPHDLVAGWAGVASETMSPSVVGVWVRS